MTIYALIRHSRGLSLHGENDEFNDNVSNNFLIEHFVEKVNKMNNTNDSIVLFMQKLVENSDGTPKLDSEQRQELKTIYVDRQYLNELSNV
jgi:hypothetical protein